MLINIHDANDNFFKISMQDLTIAKDFFKQHLATNIYEQFAWDTLETQSTNFISQELKVQETDILFKVATKDHKQNALLFLDVEHQSTCDYNMAWRILKYQVAIIEHYRKLHPDSPLPVVICCVVYNGRERYTAPTDIYELFGDQEALARQFTFNGYQLIDLTQMSDEALTQSQKLGLMQWLMKHVRDQQFMQLGEQLATILQHYFDESLIVTTNEQDYMVAVASFLLAKADIEAHEQQAFFAIMKENLPQAAGDKIMSLAQHIEQQGRRAGIEEGILKGMERGIEKGILQGIERGMEKGMEKGRNEGIQEGIRQGLLEGERKSFLRHLQRRFKVSEHYLNLIDFADEDMLVRWDNNLDTAPTIEAVFN